MATQYYRLRNGRVLAAESPTPGNVLEYMRLGAVRISNPGPQTTVRPPEEVRQNAVIDKATFLERALELGHIPTEQEAIEAAQGTFPYSFVPMLGVVSAKDAVRLQIRWPAVVSIPYSNDLVQLVGQYRAQVLNREATDVLDELYQINAYARDD